MAGVSAKELRARIHSMESTRQITKAMEMVAASKLRGAQDKAISSRPYFETLYNAVSELSAYRADSASPYSASHADGKVCCIVIAGDRGLAGGYNNNVLKTVWEKLDGRDAECLPLGKKAVEFCSSRKLPLLSGEYRQAADVSVGDCFTMARLVCQAFLQGKYSEVLLGYTNFVSVLNQSPAVLRLLPLEASAPNAKHGARSILFEPSCESVYDAIIPEYLGGLIYGALCESVASEQAARRTAMDAATKNADEMISGLNLQFNRARQGAITQEITEIVAGAEQ